MVIIFICNYGGIIRKKMNNYQQNATFSYYFFAQFKKIASCTDEKKDILLCC